MIIKKHFSIFKKFLFWQPKKDILRFLLKSKLGKYFVTTTNYIIWVFLFYISYILIKKDTNIFWQLFIATLFGEIIERLMKNKISWQRPLFKRNGTTPPGLIDCWYKAGSFPSGHTIKVVYFLLFIIQYQVFSVPLFLSIVSPILFFRVLIGLHYPIDMFGGIIIGVILWLFTKGIVFPTFLTEIIRVIFNFVFFIK